MKECCLRRRSSSCWCQASSACFSAVSPPAALQPLGGGLMVVWVGRASLNLSAGSFLCPRTPLLSRRPRTPVLGPLACVPLPRLPPRTPIPSHPPTPFPSPPTMPLPSHLPRLGSDAVPRRHGPGVEEHEARRRGNHPLAPVRGASDAGVVGHVEHSEGVQLAQGVQEVIEIGKGIGGDVQRGQLGAGCQPRQVADQAVPADQQRLQPWEQVSQSLQGRQGVLGNVQGLQAWQRRASLQRLDQIALEVPATWGPRK